MILGSFDSSDTIIDDSFDTKAVVNQVIPINFGLVFDTGLISPDWITDKKTGKAYALGFIGLAIFDTINLTLTEGPQIPSDVTFGNYDSYVPVLPDGQILFVGGELNPMILRKGAPMNSLLTYNTITSTWKRTV